MPKNAAATVQFSVTKAAQCPATSDMLIHANSQERELNFPFLHVYRNVKE